MPLLNPSSSKDASPNSRWSHPAVRMVQTHIGNLAVRDTGPLDVPGETIVLWPAILADHRIYRRQLEAWRGRHRLITIDGPGHGESGPAPGPFSMLDCGRAMGVVLDELAICHPVVIVGTSWGGLVAGEFALARPECVRALVMLNTPITTNPEGPGFSDRFVVWGACWIHQTAIYRNGVAKAFFLPVTRQRGGALQEDFHQHLREVDGIALARSVRAVLIDREPLAPRLKGITAPTLFVAGRLDAMYPVEALKAAAASLEKGRFEIVDTAHISVVDDPDKVTALIDEFLMELP